MVTGGGASIIQQQLDLNKVQVPSFDVQHNENAEAIITNWPISTH